MFANLKEKFNERLKTLTVPQDPLEKRIIDLVDRATSDVLIGPDWQTNLELVDVINTSDPNAVLEKATRALNRPLHSQNARVQLLTITALETCIKNCRRPFHKHLATSELFGSLLRIADPPPQAPVGSEVKDRVLCLVEDLAKALEGSYRHAYETLLDNGVDFPVRSPEDAVPLQIPPESAGPSNDYSEEDRAAIARAMAEMASEEQAQQQPVQQLGPAPGAPVLVNPAAAAVVASRAHPPPPTGPPQAPPAPEAPQAFAQLDASNVVKTARASGELLAEVLQALSGEGQHGGVKEAYVSELADQCKAQRSQLQELLESCTDEVVLADALGAHEELQRVLAQYEGLLAAGQPPAAASPQRTLQSPGGYSLAPQYTLSDAPAPPSTHAPAPLPTPTPAFAGAQFTLSDDDEDADVGLVTKRGPAPPLPAAPVPILPPPPTTSAPAPAADLINLGSENGSPPKYPPQSTATPATSGGGPLAAAPSGDPLMDEMDRLMSSSSLNAQSASPATQQHPPSR